MQLSFVYVPVTDLKEALAFYRDTLGLEESWREGELAAGLKLADTDVELMLDQVDDGSQAGPAFLLDDVRAFHQQRRGELRFRTEPEPIPGGWWAVLAGPSGDVVYLLDQSEAPGGG